MRGPPYVLGYKIDINANCINILVRLGFVTADPAQYFKALVFISNHQISNKKLHFYNKKIKLKKTILVS